MLLQFVETALYFGFSFSVVLDPMGIGVHGVPTRVPLNVTSPMGLGRARPANVISLSD